MLAKSFNDNACLLNERGAFEFFASKLAPTKKPLGLPAKANGNHDAKRVALDLDLLVILIWLLILGAPLNHAGRTLSGRYRSNGYTHNPTVLTARPPSRASPLPHWDGGGVREIAVGWQGVIAGKPAPTIGSRGVR